MLKTRVMPCLLLKDGALVKTVRFKDASYVGDPVNAVRIYNENEVDELVLLDITATVEERRPDFGTIAKVASECFMPVAYGGGIRRLEDIREILGLGVEKVVINSHAVENPSFVRAAAETFGSQSIVVSIDAKRGFWGRYQVCTHSGRRPTRVGLAELAAQMQCMGAGELLLTSIDRDGTMEGYDIDLVKTVTGAVGVPVVACGGAGKLEDFAVAVRQGGASAVAVGSMVVYHGRNRAVLISFPARCELERVLAQ